MSRAAEFIQLYNRLADHLLGVTGENRSTTFSRLVTLAAAKDSAVRQFSRQLQAYGDLRNAIVHDRDYPIEIIAEPSIDALGKFASIVESVTSPKRLIPTFQTHVKVYKPHDPLVDALKDMGSQDFSQIVLMNDSRLSLLTTAGIARWLQEKAIDEIISIPDATVGEAYACELPGALLVMARDKNIFDVQEAFTRTPASRNSRLFAVVITHNGRDTEMPLGIVTPWDVLNSG